MKLKKTPKGYESHDKRFEFIKCSVATNRNGYWKTAWRLLDNGKLVSDPFEERLSDCREWAEQIILDEQ